MSKSQQYLVREGGAEEARSMDKVKKILSSPLSRRRNPAIPANSPGNSSSAINSSQQAIPAASTPRYLGVPLDELVAKEGGAIPRLVTDVCNYVLKHGVTSEGIFRVNGNARHVERLRSAYEQRGGADLSSEAGDVMAVASLLKMFLREIPDGLVPQSLTHRFVRVQQELGSNRAALVPKLRTLLSELPSAHHVLLEYLCRFLQKISRYESENKMSPMALGIVFGPNIFRCENGMQGLKDQGVTNYITCTFVQDCDSLFPEKDTKNGKKRVAPPPPRTGNKSSGHPVASPRKHKLSYGDALSAPSSGTESQHSGYSEEEDEYMDSDRMSPFHLETDRSEYSLNTTTHSFTNHDVVDRVISGAITEHLFGDVTSDIPSTSEDERTPVAPPRKKRSQQLNPSPQPHNPLLQTHAKIRIEDERSSASSNESDNELKLTVKQRIQQMEEPSSPKASHSNVHSNGHRPAKQRPKSHAFDMFEKTGLIIGMAPDRPLKTLALGGDGAEVAVEESSDTESAAGGADDFRPVTSPTPAPRSRHVGDKLGDNEAGLEESMSSVQAGHTMLSSFKKPAGPKNRRTPTRRTMRGSDTLPDNRTDQLTYSIIASQDEEEKENPEHSSDDSHPNNHPHTKPLHVHIPSNHQSYQPNNNTPPSNGDLGPSNNLSPSTKFLDQPYNGNHHNSSSTSGLDRKSPLEQRKPYVPPLDLSILHEHGDGSDPISVKHGQSVSLHKMQPTQTSNHAMVSPRADKIHGQKSGEPVWDTNLPPSPPTDLVNARLQRVEEDYATQIKQHTKKIQSCKKRIKQFEEGFEAQQGYRPSQTDKAARPDIKKCMQDLAKARKELRRIKEEQQRSTEGQSGSSMGPEAATTTGSGEGVTSPGTPSMRESLQAVMKRLAAKRREGNRPEDMSLMSYEQIQEEKLAVQKALLHFESLHGRPSTKSEKELMRPLYDRYRNVKRLMAKGFQPTAPQTDLLQTVPEDTAIEFEPGSAKTTVSNREPVRVPTAEPEEDEQNAFLVTRDMRLLGETRNPALPGNTLGGGPSNRVQGLKTGTLSGTGGWMEEGRTIGGGGRIKDTGNEDDWHGNGESVLPDKNNKNLHIMTVPQLLEEQQAVREDKKRLRKVLREFEEEFHETHGRKVQKDDRSPMTTEYQEYKQVKARLKLLEALLSKHDASPEIFP